MNTFLSSIARNEFTHGNYVKSLDLYNKLAKKFGYENYKFNIEYCQRKIDSQKIHFFSILDEISNRCWSDVFTLKPLLRNSCAADLCSSNDYPLLLESCWHGNGDEWIYAFTSPGLQHAYAKALLAAIELAKKNNRKIIFWNKEDPMHYDLFLPIARLCDIIFTTDCNCIDKYKKDVPTAEIAVLPFAANINICNPLDRFKTAPQTLCFAGTYYGHAHEDRKTQMDNILPAIIKYNGVIYDRMSNAKNDRYKYPDIYKEFIKPSVCFDEIVDLYKRFLVFLNVNTITDSPTMMSRRVYEILACGTPVLSTPSRAIDEQFKGIVQTAQTADEAISVAGDLINDRIKWRRISHLGYREVMNKHTYKNRAADIAKYLNISMQNSLDKVSMITATKRPQYIDRMIQNISCQTYKNKEVVFILQGYTEDNERYLRNMLEKKLPAENSFVIIRDDSDRPLGERLNIGIQNSTGNIVAKVDDDDFYFENYISDMVIPFDFPNVDIVGKREIFIYLEKDNNLLVRFKGESHKFTKLIAGPTIIARRNVFQNVRFSSLNQGEDTDLLNKAVAHEYNIYAADPFNFIQFRSANASQHTWKVDHEYFYKNKCHIIGKGLCQDICAI